MLNGYYGFQNTGDDALLAAAVLGARWAYGAGITLTARASTIPTFPGSRLVRAAYPTAQRWRGERRVRLWLEAFRSRAILFGGGSVFHSRDGLEKVEHLLRLAGRGPHLGAGVSIGPFRSAADEQACARVLRRLTFLGLRDVKSTEIAKALAPGVPSELTFDLAPLLLVLDRDRRVPGEGRRGLGLALCDHERFTNGDLRREAARRERLGSVLRALDRDLVEEIVLIDFNGHPHKGDSRIHTEIRTMAEQAGIPTRLVPYDPRPLEVLRTIAGLRAMLAMRLHAAVFGYLVETPTVMLAYHPKCQGWAEQVGISDPLIHDSVDFDPVQLAAAVELALRGRAPVATLPISAALERARRNFPRLETDPREAEDRRAAGEQPL